MMVVSSNHPARENGDEPKRGIHGKKREKRLPHDHHKS
jgi:hypothetical protein